MQQDRNRQDRTIRVLVADNSRFHTQLLVGALSRDPGLKVTSTDLDAASLMSASINQSIDVFVLSALVEAEDQRGFRILQELKETYRNPRVVMLLDSSKPESVLEAFRAGVTGVFDHRESLDMLCQCIRQVYEGRVWINSEQMALVLDSVSSAPQIRAVGGNGLNLLSKREAEVVRCLAEGLTNREIAERLGLSQHTIKNHLFRIFDKLGVSNRIELLFMTLSQGGAATPLLQDLLKDPCGNYDPATLALLERAAEHGVLAAQLILARIYWIKRACPRDLVNAYLWFSVVLDQLARTKNTVKKAMSPSQLAEAECELRKQLNTGQRTEPSLVEKTASYYERIDVA
ncbi:MAG: LuxR C-terminal-related transcriptional regulator [Candidatus Sulfotelmatobacter sp.]